MPKGVITSHQSLMTYIDSVGKVLSIDDTDVLGNQSPLDYIAAIRDIYLPITFGAQTFIIPKNEFAVPTQLFDTLNNEKITALCWSVAGVELPAKLGAFDVSKPEYLKKLCFSGSVMPCKYLKIWQENLPDVLYVNQYGPTEATASCTYYVVNEKVDDDTKQLTATRQSRMKRSIQRHPIRKWAVILVLLIAAIGIGIGLYMHRSVSVPDVEGLTTAQAEKKLQANHLRLGKVTEKSSQTVAKNHVVKVAGSQRHAHAGQSIDLVVSRGVKTWKMADYVGDSYSDTADELRDKGFVVKQAKKYSDTVATGKIIKQSVNAGTTINPSQQTVTLTVSAGKKQVTIPSFKGKDVSEVQDFANKHQLQLMTTQKNSTTVATNHVIQQTPKAGSKLTHGDTLTVQIASNSNELRTTNIQINIPFDGNGGKKENRVQVYIRDAYHNLTMEYEDITINQETTINVPFTLRNGQTGAYRVIRNGQTIMSATNITG